MKNRVRIVLAACAGSLMLAASFQPAGVSAALSASTQSFELTKGVVVDPGPGVVYLMNPEHGIDAVELASGNLIWRSTSGAAPLLVFNDRLVAQAEASAGNRVLPIAVMNTTRGELLQSAAVPLPAPVFASIDDAMGSSFSANAVLSGGEIVVSWRFTQGAGLARPGPAPPEINGAALIDLKTARVQVLPAGSAPTQHRTKGGAPAGLRLEPGFSLSIASADGKEILANKPAASDATGLIDYLWAIYSLQTGSKLGEIRMPTSAVPFFVWKSMVIYVSQPQGRRVNGNWVQEPLALRAMDLTSGREVWKTPIRDTRYRGPLPPRP